MIGLLPVKVSMTTKEQMTLSRSRERVKTSGHFVQAVTGGSGNSGVVVHGRLQAVQGRMG